MPVCRVEKSSNYTVMANFHLKDKSLSMKAKGLLSFMLSLPDDWDFSIHGLMQFFSDGESSVRTALKELEEHEYLERTPVKSGGKFVDIQYTLYECRKDLFLQMQGIEKPLVGNQQTVSEKPLVENPHSENPHSENRTQLNTIPLNPDEQTTKQQRESGITVEKIPPTPPLSSQSSDETPKRTRFVPPTVEEVREYCEERNSVISPEKFCAYYESVGWVVGGKTKMKNWKKAIVTWELREKEKGVAVPSREAEPTIRREDLPVYEDLPDLPF